MFATAGVRRSVGLFKEFLNRRPPELRETGSFYLAVIEKPKNAVWYKKQRFGVHSINQMMKSIVTNTTVASTGKKTNKPLRKQTLVKKLRAANVERQSIIQITGHASEQSLQDYDEGSEQEQKVLSSIISNKQQLSFKSNRDQGPQFFVPHSTSAAEWKSSHHTATVNNFQQCTVTFNVIQGQSTSPAIRGTQWFVSGNICSEGLKSPEIFEFSCSES